jgi:uncharacterized protein YcbX
MTSSNGTPPSVTYRELFILIVPSLLIPALFLLVRQAQSTPNPYTYRKLGRDGTSNLADEQISDTTGSQSTSWRVKAILCHPIKSCAGIELDSATVDGAGILQDRKFVFCESIKGVWKIRTLRAPGYEKLALVKPEIWLKHGSDTEGMLVVRYPLIPSGWAALLQRISISLGLMPRLASFEVPLQPPENHDYPSERLEIWKDSPVWLDYGRHVPANFSRLVGAKNPLTLFRADPTKLREVYGNAPRKEDLGWQPIAAAVDSYPLSIQNLASVQDVARQVRDDLPSLSIRRFRPNIIVSGGSAFDEDNWKRIRIGEHEIYCPCRTTRCKLPNVDPDTADRHQRQPSEVSVNLEHRVLEQLTGISIYARCAISTRERNCLVVSVCKWYQHPINSL